jgi:hypothetical protein
VYTNTKAAYENAFGSKAIRENDSQHFWKILNAKMKRIEIFN